MHQSRWTLQSCLENLQRTLPPDEPKIQHAYQHNLKDYKNTIPQVFWYNALVILSNGSQAKIGSVTAGWEHFADWKRINSEGERGVISLETLIRGTCSKSALIDLIENFTLYDESKGGVAKITAKNHQFLGVNNAVDALAEIQKFGTKPGETYPVLSDRSDIIVMTDEAHRSQHDTLALNMRNALPNAAFIGFTGFTGTPLMAGEEKTKEVFGDYVSVDNFQQSIEGGATVPLFYENRIPELQLANEHFKEDLEALVEASKLSEEQENKREFAREYHLITRDDRPEKVAEDLVDHFMGRFEFGSDQQAFASVGEVQEAD